MIIILGFVIRDTTHDSEMPLQGEYPPARSRHLRGIEKSKLGNEPTECSPLGLVHVTTRILGTVLVIVGMLSLGGLWSEWPLA
jgi:hypothetical protein